MSASLTCIQMQNGLSYCRFCISGQQLGTSGPEHAERNHIARICFSSLGHLLLRFWYDMLCQLRHECVVISVCVGWRDQQRSENAIGFPSTMAYKNESRYTSPYSLCSLVAVRKRPNFSNHCSHSVGLNVNVGGGSNLAIASKVYRKFSGGGKSYYYINSCSGACTLDHFIPCHASTDAADFEMYISHFYTM